MPDELAKDRPAAGAADANLVKWAHANGIRGSVAPATFEGGLRGAGATADIAEGQCVMSVPEELLITAETAKRSDFGAALLRLPVDEQSLLLLWLMVERRDAESTHAPFWQALPQSFRSGLSFGEDEVALLEGTPAHTECLKATQHIQAAHRELQPVMSALLQAYPQHLKQELFSWEAFLWATELWYSYSMQVRFHEGGDTITREAIVPYACLLNHSASEAGIRQYGTLKGGRRHFTAAGCVKAGQQVYLNYGPHDNAHLLSFYGFIIPANPNDSLSVSLKVTSTVVHHPSDQGYVSTISVQVRAALDRLQLPLDFRIARDGGFGPVLDSLRVLHATDVQLTAIRTVQDLPRDNDAAVWRHLRTTLAVMKSLHERIRSRNRSSALHDCAAAQLVDAYISDRGDWISALSRLATEQSSVL